MIWGVHVSDGFPIKKLDGVGGVNSIQILFWIFWIFLPLQSP